MTEETINDLERLRSDLSKNINELLNYDYLSTGFSDWLRKLGDVYYQVAAEIDGFRFEHDKDKEKQMNKEKEISS